MRRRQLLHLVFLNAFKHIFKYTIHEGLPKSKKVLIRDYCKGAGFYSYDAASIDEDPVTHWIGREVKRFLDQAERHIQAGTRTTARPGARCAPASCPPSC